MSFRVQVKGADRLMRILCRSPSVVMEAADKCIELTASNIASLAQGYCPVRTGFLRSTIYFQRTGFCAFIVSAWAYYAPFVEYGTRKMAAQPFLRPAALVIKSSIAKVTVEQINQTWRRA